MENVTNKREIPILIILIAPVVYILAIWSQLPGEIPIHYDVHGDVNGWGGKGFAFLLPAINLGTYLLMLFLPKLDPKKMNNEFFKTNIYKLRVVIALFLSAFSALFVYMALHQTQGAGLSHYIPILAFLLFAVMGNFMINIKPNWFIGIRTPWTLSSDMVWKKTHLLFGRLWFYGGIAGIAAVILLPLTYVPVLIAIFALGSAALAFVYSYLLYRKEQEKASQT